MKGRFPPFTATAGTVFFYLHVIASGVSAQRGNLITPASRTFVVIASHA